MNPARSPVAFGRYIITRRIARGGMAEIYRARTRSVGGQSARWVAVKMMRSTLGHEELREQLFEREVRIAARLNHPNVVPVLEFGQELGRPYLAMEYVRGRDLAHLLKPQEEAKEPIPFELGLYIGLLAARGLGHAHRLRDEETKERLDIVHRDVSPGNVMVGYDGTVKVLDFGVARVNETQGFQTQTGTLRGKFAYMSPEQTLGEELDARSDVFSFGTVLYELLTGTNCFRSTDPIATLERVQGMRPIPPSRARPDIPKDVDRILAQCLSKDRRRRFPDGIAVSEAIEEYLNQRAYSGHEPLVAHMATTFSWEQHEEASELAREEEEVALMEVVDFVPDLTNDGLDSKHIAVSTQQEASSSEVRQMTVHVAGGSVFEDEPEPRAPIPEPAAAPHPLTDDAPLGRGQAVEAASLLQPAGDLGLSSPAAPPSWTEADNRPTAHTAIAETEPPVPSPARAVAWYRGPAFIAAGAAAGILLVSWLVGGSDPFGRGDDHEPPPTLAPVTIRLDEQGGAKRARRASSTASPDASIGPAAANDDPSVDGGALARTDVPGAGAGARSTAEANGADPSPPPRPGPPARPEPADRADDSRTKRSSPPSAGRTGRRRSAPRARSRARRRRAKKEVTGYLNVGAKPWAEITIDGKRWPYQTPQAGIELPVGKHVVVLHNPKTGVTKRTAVYIKRGQYRTVNLDLRRRR